MSFIQKQSYYIVVK